MLTKYKSEKCVSFAMNTGYRTNEYIEQITSRYIKQKAGKKGYLYYIRLRTSY